MANTLTGIVPTVYMALDTVAREFVGFLPNVSTDSAFARVAKGQQITSFIAPPAFAADIVPAAVPPNDGDQVFGSFGLTITKSRYVAIKWNGEEQLALSNASGGFGSQNMMVQQFAQAFRTLTNEIETDLAVTAYKAASRATGTPGTTPFGVANDLSDFANAAQVLDVNGTPMSDRTMVINAPSMSNIRGKQSVLFKVNESGDGGDLLRRGYIGEAEGFKIGYAPAIKGVVKGTGTGYVTSSGGTLPVGTTAIPLATGTGTANAGDCVSFAGDSNVYVVGTGVSAPGTITINSPGLLQALPTGTAMTIGNSFMPNIAIQRNGLLLGTRLPAAPMDMQGRQQDMADDQMTITDPFSGLSFDLSLYRGYRQLRYELGIAWGTAVTKSDFVSVLRG